MLKEEYEFGESAQLKLLALLVRETDEAMPIIEPRFFTNPLLTDIARIAKEAYADKDLKSTRLQRDSLRALVWAQLRRGGRFHALKGAYMRTVKEIFKIELPDREIMMDLARKFAKEVFYRQALVDAEKDVNAGRYERVAKRFDFASFAQAHPNQSGGMPVYHLHKFVSGRNGNADVSNHVVYPIIPKAGATLLYGLPKELKSWMGAALAVGAASGGKALDFFEVPRRVNALYVQIEDPEFLTQERIRLLAWNPGCKKPVGMLKIIPRCGLNLMDPNWLAEFKAEIERFRPKLIVLDVFRRLFRGNVADAKETSEFLQILDGLRDTYRTAVLLVHHAKKGATAEIQAKALGSVNLTAWADVLLYTCGKRRVGKASVADLHIESKSTVLDESKLAIVVDSDAFPVVRVLDQGKYEIESLLSCIHEKPGRNQEQIGQKSGVPEKKLRTLLKRAVEDGLLREKRGRRKSLLYYPAK